MTDPDTTAEENKQFVDFLYKEYDNIAEAHFKTIDSISDFFKNYITILSIPIPVVVIIFNLDIVKDVSLSGVLFNNVFIKLATLLFGVISLVGLMVFSHILNLRWDSLLYARTVNGIRKFFFDHTNLLSPEEKARTRILPQSTSLPGYREFEYFFPVIIAFILFNSTYCYLTLVLLRVILFGSLRFNNLLIIVLTILFGLIHYILYIILSDRRENKYLRSNIMGVDIDGVLNLHRDQFCKILHQKTNKSISPEQITEIPVQNCSGLNVNPQEEISVFNDPIYWTEMPCDSQAARVLGKIQNSLQVEIHIFTSRPWPVPSYLSTEEYKILKKEWKVFSKDYENRVFNNLSFKLKLRFWLKSIARDIPYRKRLSLNIFQKDTSMERITKIWLEKNNFEYARIMVEKRNEHVSITNSKAYNRFSAAKIMPIKYFVEDDLMKAEKLAYICDFVFLIDQPYNDSPNLPSNIFRVADWEEIYERMKKLG